MRAILINPFEETVTEIDLPREAGDKSMLRALQTATGGGLIDIVSVGHDRLGLPVDLVCDDDGLGKGEQRYFRMGALLIGGLAVLVSHDGHGDTTPTSLSAQDAAKPIEWVPAEVPMEQQATVVTSFETVDELLTAMGLEKK